MNTAVLEAKQVYCPISERICTEARSDALDCNERFDMSFDPVNNLKDFAMICCAMDQDKQEK